MRRLGVAVLALGCGAPPSKTLLNPAGPPVVLQVFMTERDASGDATLMLGYGTHPDRAADVPDDDGKIETGVVYGERINVVVDELLEGSSVEQFACACSATSCGAGPAAAADASACPDDPGTSVDEKGRWLDTNLDGLPDDPQLIPGTATITCGGVVWTSGPDDGFYNPAGNQVVPFDPSGLPNWDALGPSIILTPQAPLPTSASCTLAIASTVTDKDGNSLSWPSGAFTFTTEPFALLSTAPADGTTGVDVGGTISATFNTLLDPATLGGVTVTDAGGNAVAGTAVVDADGVTVDWTPDAPFAPSTMFTATIAGVADTFGATLAAPATFTFTTGT
jgi:hypothetical protein